MQMKTMLMVGAVALVAVFVALRVDAVRKVIGLPPVSTS